MNDETGFSLGAGDAGQFIVQLALKHGGRALATSGLPVLSGDWKFSKDDNGAILHFSRERFNEVQAFLRQAFGDPAQEPTDTMDGGKMGWYAAKAIGVGLQFGYDSKRTQVIVLRAQPVDEIIKRLQKMAENG